MRSSPITGFIKTSGLLISCLAILVLPDTSLAESSAEVVSTQLEKTNNRKQLGRKKGNFIAVPIPMSNPTLGTGLQGALLYLHPPKTDSQPVDGDDEEAPNTTTALGGMYTDSQSWILGAFHDNYLLNDRLRVRIAGGSGELNMKYFGSGENPEFADNPLEYSISANLFFGQVLGRVPLTRDWFGGLRVIYMDSDFAFDLNQFLPGNFPDLPVISSDFQVANLGLVFNYDSRDDNYYPTSGNFVELTFAQDSESYGSDFNFERNSYAYNHYFPVTDNDVIAVRGYTSMVYGDDIPFFLKPTLTMRGFASGLYQDDAVISGHLEWRHKFHPRWGWMLSYELGRVAGTFSSLQDAQTVESLGAGIRWQASEAQPMNLGLDVGISGNDKAIYISVGEKF